MCRASDQDVAKMVVPGALKTAYRQSPELRGAISERCFYRNVQEDHPRFRRGKRKLDCCEKCVWHDKVIAPRYAAKPYAHTLRG